MLPLLNLVNLHNAIGLSFRLDKRPGDFTAFYSAARISLSVCCELGWPRSASIAMLLETRDLLHQHNRKRKVAVIKTRRYKETVLRFVFCI